MNSIKTPIIVLFILLLILITILILRANNKESYESLPYRDLIEKYAKEYDLDPFFIASVIKVESSFKKDARSSMDRRGLMQITKETGDWISLKLGEDNFSYERLYEPELNIRYGSFYLRYLLDKYEYWHIAVAAYNAGMTNVDQWLKNEILNEDLESANNIPFTETREYVFKIKDAYDNFKRN